MTKISRLFGRRGFLSGTAAMFSAVLYPRLAKASVPTPRATEGPYYPTPAMRLNDTDNDLVRVAGKVREAGGQIITLTGTITDRNGTPLTGLRIEIWQTDVFGKYLHTGDQRPVEADDSFQGFGYDITDENGQYRFRTIKPGKYPSRTEHIHVKILDGDRELLVTQFYEADSPHNAGDEIFGAMSAEQAASVSMIYVPTGEGEIATVNVVI